MNLSEYILLPRETRTQHIDLSTPCVPLSGGTYHRRKQQRFDSLEVVNDLGNLQQAKVHECHLCPNCAAPKFCGNPLHIYIGSATENVYDISPELRVRPQCIQYLPHSIEQSSKAGKIGSVTTNSQKWQCLVTGKITTSGPLTCWQKARGIDLNLRKQLHD